MFRNWLAFDEMLCDTNWFCLSFAWLPLSDAFDFALLIARDAIVFGALEKLLW